MSNISTIKGFCGDCSAPIERMAAYNMAAHGIIATDNSLQTQGYQPPALTNDFKV